MNSAKRLALVLAIAVAGCATLKKRGTVAARKAADVVTTVAALNSGCFVEANRLLLGSMPGPGLIIGLSVAFVAVLWGLDDPKANSVASSITCVAAEHNVLLL
ncbi:MAG: hypothetical protein HY661_07655 [Betaproteobacteria bacterium]|nr:hypothetical protein [Betaproteobacteria bacterium]